MKDSTFGGITVGILGAVALGISYLSQPNSTSVQNAPPIPIPAVTFCNGIEINWAIPGSGGTSKRLSHPREYLKQFNDSTLNSCQDRNFMNMGDWDVFMIHFVNHFNPSQTYYMVIPPEMRALSRKEETP